MMQVSYLSRILHRAIRSPRNLPVYGLAVIMVARSPSLSLVP